MFVQHTPAVHPVVHAAPPHPTPVVETQSLALVDGERPALWYTPRVDRGLSQVQVTFDLVHGYCLPRGRCQEACKGTNWGV